MKKIALALLLDMGNWLKGQEKMLLAALACPAWGPDQAAFLDVSFDYQKSSGKTLPGIHEDRKKISEMFRWPNIQTVKISDEDGTAQQIKNLTRDVFLSRAAQVTPDKHFLHLSFVGHSVPLFPVQKIQPGGKSVVLDKSHKKALALILPGMPNDCPFLNKPNDDHGEIPEHCFRYLVYVDEILDRTQAKNILFMADSCYSGACTSALGKLQANQNVLGAYSTDAQTVANDLIRKKLPSLPPSEKPKYVGPTMEQIDAKTEAITKKHGFSSFDAFNSLFALKGHMEQNAIVDLNKVKLGARLPFSKEKVTKKLLALAKELKAKDIDGLRQAYHDGQPNAAQERTLDLKGGLLVEALYQRYLHPEDFDLDHDQVLSLGELTKNLPADFGHFGDERQKPGVYSSCNNPLEILPVRSFKDQPAKKSPQAPHADAVP